MYSITKKDLAYLSEVQRDIDLVELQAPGERGALPPALCPIDGIRDGVSLVAVCRGADVTVLALLERIRPTFSIPFVFQICTECWQRHYHKELAARGRRVWREREAPSQWRAEAAASSPPLRLPLTPC